MVSKTEVVPEWENEIIEYLEKGALSSDKKSAVQLRTKATRFTMVNGTFYKQGFMLPLLKCISSEEGDYVLREIYKGICGNHSRARVLAYKTIRAGFYWPHMSQNSIQIVRNYDKCQHFANVTK